MNQEVVAANCVWCGRIVEFICPHLNKRVQKLTVRKAAWSGQLSRCPHCLGEMYLEWTYADDD